MAGLADLTSNIEAEIDLNGVYRSVTYGQPKTSSASSRSTLEVLLLMFLDVSLLK